MPLVAGVDSSTQSCKVVVRDAHSGALMRSGRAGHPPGTEVDAEAWWVALQEAVAAAGGLDGVAAVSVAAQQHGLVTLDDRGATVRPALLWNDLRSAAAADELVTELGPEAWATAVGSVPVASFTITKLRWLAAHEPAQASQVAAACLPHDWLTWKLSGDHRLESLATDRGDASGTGYWSPEAGCYRHDLVEVAFGRRIEVPRVLGPVAAAGTTAGGALLGPGTGDNMAAAFGLDAAPGDVIVSVGTSGVVGTVSPTAMADPTGTIAGFADAGGAFLPLVCTLNGAPVLDATAATLGVDAERFAALALSAPPGAEGLVVVPYFNGERTPNLPDATGVIAGIRGTNLSPANLARAAVEGLLCGLLAGLHALVAQGLPVQRVILVGGGARSRAVREIAPAVFGCPVVVPSPGEYVADGAARQAAWVLDGGERPPPWGAPVGSVHEAPTATAVVEQYHEVAAALIGP